MKYGESSFDILYLLFAVAAGILILRRARNRTERYMGLAVLLLGLGDAFHLVPRVLNYFVDADFTAALGVGKLVTSITMTVFYVFLYHIWRGYYRKPENKRLRVCINLLAVVRVLLCLLPQNRWLENGSSVLWGTIRNVPFVILGAMIAVLYFRTRKETRRFRLIWLWVTLSFLFYIPVAVAAGVLPVLGMLMLPKTICYILIIAAFYSEVCPRRSERGPRT